MGVTRSESGYSWSVPEKLTPEEALDGLKLIDADHDTESAHAAADEVLLSLLRFYGAPAEVISAYDSVRKWYA